MSHPECNLKIEYIYRTKLRQQVCRGEHRSPVEETSPRLQPLQDRTKNYPITLVGDGALDVPPPRLPLSPCMACEKNTNLAPSSGLSRAPAPTDIWDSLFLRKIAPLFAYLHCAQGQKGGADFILRYHFHLISDFFMLFFIKSAPCRLAPNEALPHTPLGALPLDPTSPLAPGLSVRFISRFARCFIFTLCL